MVGWTKLMVITAFDLVTDFRRSAGTLLLLATGYVVIITSVLLVLGVAESEWRASWEMYGNGDPKRSYVLSLPEGAETDYERLMTDWLGSWNFERMIVITRGGVPVNWALMDYQQSPEGVPPLHEGRYFTREEVASGALVALIDQEAGKALTGGSVAIGQHVAFAGREWEVVGIVGDTIPVSGRSFAYARNRIWVPVRSAMPLLGSVQGHDGTAYLYAEQPLTADELARLAENASTVSGVRLEPYRVLDSIRNEADWMALLLGAAVGLGIAMYGALNLGGLVRYWLRRRRAEFGIRLATGAAAADISRMILLQQGLLLALAFGVACLLSVVIIPPIRSLGLTVVMGLQPYLFTALITAVILAVVHLMAMRDLRGRSVASYLKRGVQ